MSACIIGAPPLYSCQNFHEEHPQNLCLDAGYTGSGDAVEQRDYIPYIRPRGEAKKESALYYH